MTWNSDWQKVVWTDEKRFNLDGPDGFRDYWHDLRKELIFYKRQQGGVGLMIWAAFSFYFKSHVTIVEGKADSERYQKVLQEHVSNIQQCLCDNEWLFEQDNAKIHI